MTNIVHTKKERKKAKNALYDYAIVHQCDDKHVIWIQQYLLYIAIVNRKIIHSVFFSSFAVVVIIVASIILLSLQ